MILNPESQWKKLLKKLLFLNASGVGRNSHLLENQLDEALGKETEEKKRPNLLQEREERFLLFTQLLSSWRSERKTLKALETMGGYSK